MNKRTALLIGISFLAIQSVIFLQSTALAGSSRLYDAELIDIYANFKDNVLRARFIYINRKKGQTIKWEKGSVDCNCSVYGIDKRDRDKMKPNIITTQRKFLRSYNQKIFIDIPENISQKYKKGFIQCDMAVGWDNFQVKDEFNF